MTTKDPKAKTSILSAEFTLRNSSQPKKKKKLKQMNKSNDNVYIAEETGTASSSSKPQRSATMLSRAAVCTGGCATDWPS